MKDHELRELINAVTEAARTYAGTQQLRERISHLIVPAIRKEFQYGRNSIILNQIPPEYLNGPDFTDGHDCEGFMGGCERMGCPGGSECTELPVNKKS